jgi:predicted MPP superfamily phosphohydrolase
VEELNDSFYVVGRKDRSMKRVPVEQLVAPLDPSKFAIVLDHQPNDYKAEAAAGCDLVLSGHTHGGQMIPIGPIGELIGVNDATYGLEKREETVFIVTSGIADWAIPFKSGTVSEYCIIDIEGI